MNLRRHKRPIFGRSIYRHGGKPPRPYTVIVKFGGGPVGVSSLAVAVAVGEEPDTIEEVYEPYPIMEGYLQRTAQGRVATELSYKKLGLKPNTGRQASLF